MKKPSKAQLRLLADAVHLYHGRLSTSDYRADCGVSVLQSTLEALLARGLFTLSLGGTQAPMSCILHVTDAGKEACRELVLEMEAREKERARKTFELDDSVAEGAWEGLSPVSKPVPVPPPRKTHSDHLLEVALLLGVSREPWETLGERVVQAVETSISDANRWRKLTGRGRVRVRTLGASKIGQRNAHISLELWGAPSTGNGGADDLLRFVDGLEESS